jgi:eukaryotic-like serine/threonine-protein kinase
MASDIFGIVGSVIAGAYQVEAVVAEGGFGVVYRAHHTGFRAPVALKCLKIPQQLGEEYQADFLEQFRAEAELLFRLSASIPTVVRPLHVDAVTTASGAFVPFMALEWLEGETLEAIMEERRAQARPPLSLRKLVRLLTPVARALERAHNYVGPEGPISIVHRDLKPENIFVARVAGEEVVKILDFGIGKAKSVASQVAGRASQTHNAWSSFTPAYGAPEQWLPKRYGQTGPWTDVWGLALTVVEAMAGHVILDGDHAAMMGTAVDPERRPTPRNEGVQVSDAVEEVFERALAVDPRDRYAHAGSFWNALLDATGLSEAPNERPLLRDDRSDGAIVPRLETIEAAMPARSARISGMQSRLGAVQEREAETLAADSVLSFGADLAASDLPPTSWPARVSARAPSGGASPGPARSSDSGPSLVIPDLPDSMPAPSRRSSPSVPPALLDLDDAVPAGLELKLDLATGERPERRISQPSLRAVSPPSSGIALGTDPVPPRGVPSSPPPRTTDGGRTSRPSPSGPPAVSAPISRPPQPPRVGPLAAVARAQSSERRITRELLPGAALIAGSILLTLADEAYAAGTGHVAAFGPVRVGWVAGLLMLAGVLLVIYRLLPRGE